MHLFVRLNDQAKAGLKDLDVATGYWWDGEITNEEYEELVDKIDTGNWDEVTKRNRYLAVGLTVVIIVGPPLYVWWRHRKQAKLELERGESK